MSKTIGKYRRMLDKLRQPDAPDWGAMRKAVAAMEKAFASGDNTEAKSQADSLRNLLYAVENLDD